MQFSLPKSTRTRIVFAIGMCIYLLSGSCYGQISKDSTWIQTKEGCKVFNPHPVKNETITWSGECVGGYASGEGILTWFKSGKQNQKYTGQMKRGIPNGSGEYEHSDGMTYKGTYLNGELSGIGQITRKDKNNFNHYIYTGQITNDAPDGYGEEIKLYSAGDTLSVYKGHFVKWEKQGPGSEKVFLNDLVTILKGNFNQEISPGHVEIWVYRDKVLEKYYNGNFNDKGRNGSGSESIGLNKYSGEWMNNKKNGKGNLYFDSVLIYEGDWKNDKFNGTGKRYFIDGSYYLGEFKNNQRDGFGVQYGKNGQRYIGEFRNDLFQGMGYSSKGNVVIHAGSWVKGSLAMTQNINTIKKALDEKYKSKMDSFLVK